MLRKDILLLAGTRPEAVKLAPVALELADDPLLRPVLVHSGQHLDMVGQALEPFGLTPDETLGLRRRTGGQAELFAELLPALDALLGRRRPAAVLVQGDTSTALAGALAAFWRQIPVAHLEAGLRTGDLTAPFPEEGNRQLIARIADVHLAPTAAAAAALHTEAVPADRVILTGNTVVDAVRHIAYAALPLQDPALATLAARLGAGGGRLALVTAHRRESWGAPLAEVVRAVRELVDGHPDLHVVLPAHPNPEVRAQVVAGVEAHPRILVTEPLSYPDLVWALRRSTVVLTDSGGIQEEAPSFGVPVLVLRDVTERQEAVDAGCAWLVGTDRERVLHEARRVLATNLRVPLERNPFGDGRAAERVRTELVRLCHPGARPVSVAMPDLRFSAVPSAL